jgi:formylglycine-generating enzyme
MKESPSDPGQCRPWLLIAVFGLGAAGCDVDSHALGVVPGPDGKPAEQDAEPGGEAPVDARADAVSMPPDAPSMVDAPRALDASGPDAATPDAAPPAPDAAVIPDLAAPDAGDGCPVAHGGPALVRVGDFCIDATEVTNADYAVFWTARRSGQETGGQIPACSWNNSFTPESGGGARWPARAGDERRPVVSVDWCDAYAFCQWAGKRLCGRIDGGALPRWQAATDPGMSQWTYACATGGRSTYPYGNRFDATACNVQRPNENASILVDVASRPGCRTEAGVYDLSGNVEEWVDACTGSAGRGDSCAVLGASAFDQRPDNLTCTGSAYGDPRGLAYELRGFRCCAP